MSRNRTFEDVLREFLEPAQRELLQDMIRIDAQMLNSMAQEEHGEMQEEMSTAQLREEETRVRRAWNPRQYQIEVNEQAAQNQRRLQLEAQVLREVENPDPLRIRDLQSDINDAMRYTTHQMQVPIPIIEDEMEDSDDEEIANMFESLINRLKPAKKPKAQWNKAIFLQSINADADLIDELKDIHDKESVLKAVFAWNNKPKKAVTYPVNKKALAFVSEYNNSIDRLYMNRLEDYYTDSINAYKRGNVGDFVSDREGTIVKGKALPTDIFTHPLFRIVTVKAIDMRGFRDSLSFTFETRDEVTFTYMNKRINAGTFRFRLYLNPHYFKQRTRFCKKNDNFTGNSGPYIFVDGAICTGDSSASLHLALREGRLYEYMTELYTVMTQYNLDSHPCRTLDRMIDDIEKGLVIRRDGSKIQVTYLTEDAKPEVTKEDNEEIPF